MFHLEALPAHSAVLVVGALALLGAGIVWMLLARTRARELQARAKRRSRARARYARFWDKVMLRRAPRMLTDQRQDEPESPY